MHQCLAILHQFSEQGIDEERHPEHQDARCLPMVVAPKRISCTWQKQVPAGNKSIPQIPWINLSDERYIIRGVYFAFFIFRNFLSCFPSCTTFSVSPACQSPDHCRHFSWSAGTGRNTPRHTGIIRYTGIRQKTNFTLRWVSLFLVRNQDQGIVLVIPCCGKGGLMLCRMGFIEHITVKTAW